MVRPLWWAIAADGSVDVDADCNHGVAEQDTHLLTQQWVTLNQILIFSSDAHHPDPSHRPQYLHTGVSDIVIMALLWAMLAS